MKFPRRRFLRLAASAAALPAMPPCGGVNIVVRLVGQWLSDRVGTPGRVPAPISGRASPDGCTLLVAAVANTFNATLYDKLNFNFVRNIVTVASIIRVPGVVVVVNPSLPAKTVCEFIALVKANPGKVNIAPVGSGSTGHVFGELSKFVV